VRPGAYPEDVGLAVANIQASPTTQFGTVPVTFPSSGPYELIAVSGPDDTPLGTSNQVNAFTIPPQTSTVTSAYPTSTSTSKPTPSATVQPTHITSGVHHSKNLGAIIGGTLGGLAFLGILAALAIMFFRRRKPTDTKRRWTFYRDRMVRPTVTNTDQNAAVNPVSVSPTQCSSHQDVEHGLNQDTDPFVMIASPNGPRPLRKPTYRPLPLPPLTDRQDAIVKQIERVKDQITELEQNAGPTQHIMLDDMQKQITWLQDQVGSAWAMGLTDVAPLGFTNNLKTP